MNHNHDNLVHKLFACQNFPNLVIMGTISPPFEKYWLRRWNRLQCMFSKTMISSSIVLVFNKALALYITHIVAVWDTAYLIRKLHFTRCSIISNVHANKNLAWSWTDIIQLFYHCFSRHSITVTIRFLLYIATRTQWLDNVRFPVAWLLSQDLKKGVRLVLWNIMTTDWRQLTRTCARRLKNSKIAYIIEYMLIQRKQSNFIY